MAGTAGLREVLGALSALLGLAEEEAVGLALGMTGTAGLTAARRAGAALLSLLLLIALLMALMPPPPPPLTPPDIDCRLDRTRLCPGAAATGCCRSASARDGGAAPARLCWYSSSSASSSVPRLAQLGTPLALAALPGVAGFISLCDGVRTRCWTAGRRAGEAAVGGGHTSRSASAGSSDSLCSYAGW